MLVLVHAFRAALLDAQVYKEIGEDTESMLRALGVVVVAAIAFGLGTRMTPAPEGLVGAQPWMEGMGVQNVRMLMAASIILVSWVLWSAIAYYVGSVLLRGQASYRMMLRALGIAYSPAVLLVLIGVPQIGGLLLTIMPFWLLATGIVAIRSIEDFNWIKTALPALMGWFFAWLMLPATVPLF